MVTSTDPLVLLVLMAASVAVGLVVLVIARRVSNPAEIRRARRRVIGLLLEMWLYGDSPRQLVRTWFALAEANLRYAALVLPTALACTGPMILLWFALDPMLGRAPISPGGTAIVTVRRAARDAQLTVPAGVRVETPPLRLEAGEIQWRIRVERGLVDNLQVAGGRQRIVAGDGLRYLADWLGPVGIGYPERSIRFWGFDLRWEWWAALLSSLTAVCLHRRFGVSI